MLRITADNKIPFLKGVLEQVAGVDYFPGRDIGRTHIVDSDALIVRTRTKCNRLLLEGTPVRYIATATIGFDHIDADYCREAGISWSNAPGCNSGSVMQYIASAISYISTLSGKGSEDLTIGIIGVGHVGSKVEKLGRVLGMKVLLNDPPRERIEGSTAFTSLDDLLANSDIVTMHVPLSRAGDDATIHMAGRRFFNSMSEGAWFVNTSRGEVAHTAALKEVLNRKHLGGAVIDVWEQEPDIDRELLSMADIATPHIAGYSLDGKANGTAQSVRSLSNFFGLGLGDWFPEVPLPERPSITLENCDANTLQEIAAVFMHTYDILADSNRLKSDPGSFERLRDEYPPRREFEAYTINTRNPGSTLIGKLKQLGFR